ncbi:MAG: substrate-binding domain-containing protein [Tannerellaceae bacterium]|nr:substrate-binding domain-containing protein [Tannerellaceae bacterium]
MKYEKLILLYTILIGIVYCTGCTKQENNQKKFIIGFSQCTSDPWREAVLLEMQIEISNYKNVELVVYNAMDNSSRQVSQIRRLISQNVDVLIISPNEAVPITPVAVEAYKKGIPTIIHDRKIQSDEYTVSIGANNYDIGSVIGEYINELLPPRSCILEVWGLEGSSPAIERHEGFINALDKKKEYKVNYSYGKWHYNIAEEEIEKIESFKDIDLIYAHNDLMAFAARDVIMRKDSTSGKRIKFIGIDGVYGDGAGIEAVAEGKLEASFQYPTGGAIAIQVAMAIINGEPVQKNYTLNTTIIDKTNAKTILAQSEQVNNYQQRINMQKQVEDNLLSRFQFLRNSTLLILALLALIVPLLTYVMYINLKIKNKNRELYEKNKLVESQKEELSIKNQQIENISNQKLQFFTNISHEIRTPITLIIGPLNKLLNSHKVDPGMQEDMLLIKRNADRLYRIVNQILDFRRIDNDKMKLVLREIDLITLCMEVFDYFRGIAEEKQISYEFRPELKTLPIYIDINKIEQVLVNILSNAFKYSGKKGSVIFRIKDADEKVIIEVEDTGKGLTKEDQAHLFERFYTGNIQSGVSGFGIGLNLSKEYIDLHDGSIDVESQPGEYTLFRITLYKDINHYTREYTIDNRNLSSFDQQAVEIDNTLIHEKLSRCYEYKILIVEDDPEVRGFLQRELSQNFTVKTADNGNEALRCLMEDNEISLIISDVLMPELNGFQLCNRIKNDIAYSHIPIILLTALSEDSQQLYGIAGGADEYIRKPFTTDFVKIRIINMIEERNRMKQAFMEKLKTGFTDHTEINKIVSVDDLFRFKLLEITEQSYENSDFSIEDLSDQLGLSRVHLYRKVKAIFGLSPTDFLRNYRLNKALGLLEQKQYSISEIGYMTGFTSPAYFTKCFKAFYNKTPSEFLNEK